MIRWKLLNTGAEYIRLTDSDDLGVFLGIFFTLLQESSRLRLFFL